MIAYLINNLRSGGAENFVKILSEEISKEIEVIIILLNDYENHYTLPESSSVKLIILRGNTMARKYINLIKIVRENNLAVMHVNLFPALYVAALLPNRPKLLFTEHGIWNKRRKKAFVFIEKYIYSKYEKIVCVSNTSRNALIEHLGKEFQNRAVTIYNGNFSKTCSPKYVESSDEKWHIILIGRLEYPKDQLSVLKALVPISEKVHVDVYGVGDKRIELADYARLNNINITFHGFVENLDQERFPIKSIGVLSSFKEGFGLALLDTMSRGIVTFGTDVGGIREVLNNNELLFTAGDSKTLTKQIERIINDVEYQYELKKYCTKRSLDFSLEKMTSKYKKLYRELSAQ